MNSERRQLIDLLHINENALQMARDVSDVVFLLRQNAATRRALGLSGLPYRHKWHSESELYGDHKHYLRAVLDLYGWRACLAAARALRARP